MQEYELESLQNEGVCGQCGSIAGFTQMGIYVVMLERTAKYMTIVDREYIK